MMMMLQQDLPSHRKRLMIQTELMDRTVVKELKTRTSPAASQKEGNQIWGSKFSNGVYFLDDNEQVKPWGSVAF